VDLMVDRNRKVGHLIMNYHSALHLQSQSLAHSGERGNQPRWGGPLEFGRAISDLKSCRVVSGQEGAELGQTGP